MSQFTYVKDLRKMFTWVHTCHKMNFMYLIWDTFLLYALEGFRTWYDPWDEGRKGRGANYAKYSIYYSLYNLNAQLIMYT